MNVYSNTIKYDNAFKIIMKRMKRIIDKEIFVYCILSPSKGIKKNNLTIGNCNNNINIKQK